MLDKRFKKDEEKDKKKSNSTVTRNSALNTEKTNNTNNTQRTPAKKLSTEQALSVINKRFGKSTTPTVAKPATVGKSPVINDSKRDETEEKESLWEVMKSTGASGLATFNKGLASTLDFLMPTEFLGKYDIFSNLNDYYSEQYDLWEEDRQKDLSGYGTVGKTVSDLGVSTINALPSAALALMSGGTSAAAQGASLATQTASNAGTSAAISNALKTVAKDPQFWFSFAQTAGNDYEYAKETGANDLEATLYALATSGMNAAVERGSGIQTLPGDIKGGANPFLSWLKSGFVEGGEELLQKGISGTMEKGIYNPDKEIFSTTNKDAIINPMEMGKEAAMGAGVGWLLGGGQTAVSLGANAVNNNRIRKLGKDYSVDTEAVIQEGLESDPNSEAHKIAEELQAKYEAGETITNTELGRAVIATEAEIRKEEQNAVLGAKEQPATLEEAAQALVNDSETDATTEISEETQETDKLPVETIKTEKPLQKRYLVAYDVWVKSRNPDLYNLYRNSDSFDATVEIMNKTVHFQENADNYISVYVGEGSAREKIGTYEYLGEAYSLAEDYIWVNRSETDTTTEISEENKEIPPVETVQNNVTETVQEPAPEVVPTLEQRAAEVEAKAVEAAYELGKQNAPRESVKLETAAQEEAYNAGRIEHIKNMPKEDTNIDSKPAKEYTVSGKMTDKTKRALDFKTTRQVVGVKDGRAYISDGHIAIPIEETDVEYAKSEWGLKDNENIARVVEETANNEYVPISTNPVEGVLPGVGSVYMFTTDDGRKIAIKKKYAKYFDGYNLSATFDNGKPYAIKATDADGNFAGLVMGIGLNKDGIYNITDTKEVSMKSFKNKPKKETKIKNDIANVNDVPVKSDSIPDERTIRAAKAIQKSTGMPEEEAIEKASAVWESIDKRNGKTENTQEPEITTKEQITSNAQDQIANDVIKYIESGKDFSTARLFEIADKAYGGTMAEGKYTVKDAYDGMELAVNRYLMNADFVKDANGNAQAAVKTVDKLIDLLSHIPTQTKRTEEMESYQQFSTPPNIAYLAAWTANINNADVVLEPSAGIGGLALWGKAWGATVYANELSERRLQFLNQLGLDGTFNLNAEQIDNLLPDNIKPSVVVMNPPFSATAGRMSKNDTSNAKRHIEQALERLEPNGRLVAILGNGMADDTPTFRVWWSKLRSEYNVRANIRIDGSNYRKYGTTFDVQLVVIDKTGPNTEQTITGTYKDLSEIPALLEGIRNDRQRTVQRGDAVTVRDTAIANDTERQRGLERASRNTSDVLDGEQRASEDSVRTPDGKRAKRSDGTRNNRTERDSETVRSNKESKDTSETEQRDTGTRMELSRSDERDDIGRAAVKDAAENPDSVYATYVPRKVNIKGAKKHPARLVESAAMAAVEPPDVTYTPALPASIAAKGILSDAQLENVVYAGQAHAQTLGDGSRKGFFIGDGTGVGKGRQISGIIMDNFMQGRKKAVWISASTGLVNDARRDWKDLGGNPDDIIDLKGTKLLKTGIQADSGILFGAYSTLSNSANKEQRFALLKNWLGEDFDGVIALDEAHKMGNSVPMKKKRGKSKPSQQALTGIELQKAFPNARIVYASATGATDVSQYGYLERLGLWGKGTAFNNLNDFIEKISNGGLAAMELVARDMKAMGVYMARSISYDDVKYDTLQHDLTPMQTEIYDTMSEAWQKVLQNVNEALEVTGADKNGQARGAAYSAIFGGQQRFYNQILTSMSMPSVIEDIRKELAAGHSCVIQLTNTNEAQANRAIAKNEAEGGNLEDLDLTPSETLTQLLEKSFPVQVFEEYMDEEGRVKSRMVKDADGNPVIDKKAVRMRDKLIEELQQMKVPDGPLEMLLDAFGVDQVAEVTGRSRRVVDKRDENGNMRRVIETRSATAGTADAKAFQDGKKRILVFSDAGGTGFSYHADKRAKNQQQRVHYLLQPGWSASNAVQGFGRTHRSNQASAPIVRLITTNAMGQKRFTSTIARRLDQLGALTKGQRQTGSGVFSEKDNLENPIAADALSQYYKGADRDILKKLGLYDSLFDEYGRINEGAEDLRNVSKFLNRILSLKVDEQNEVFQGFYDTFERMMDVAISNGTVDMGLENYRADKIDVIDETVIRKDETGADTKYVQMKTYKKPEITPYSKLAKNAANFKGLVRMEDGGVRAVFEMSSKTNARGEIERRFRLESPVKGVSNTFVEKTLNEKTTEIDKADWKSAWESEIDKAPEYNEGTLHLLTGTLLPIWNRLPQSNTRVMRVLSSDGRQYLGRVIAPSQIDLVLKGLGAGRTMQTYTPQQITDAVLTQGKEVSLRDNRQKIIRRRVSNEWRMEITGQNTWYLARQYPNIISERINYEYRYFIPTGEAGTKILEDIIKNNPVVDVHAETKTGDVDYARGAKGVDHSDQWTAERVGDKNKQPKSLAEIIEGIRHDFGVNLTTGHIRGSDIRGLHTKGTGGIRTKIAQDLPVVAHELGHEFDEKYGLSDGISEEIQNELVNQLDDGLREKYPAQKLVGEGIAEYVRKFLQNRETAAIDYPLFTDYFLSAMTGKELALIEQLADDVNAYYALDVDTATSSIRLYGEKAPDARTFAEKAKEKASVIYQAFMDANHGIKRFDLATGANTYKLALNAAYSDAIAGNMISGGDLTDANGQYVAPGLLTALHGLNLNNKADYILFGEYLTVKHGPERLAEGMRTFADDRKNSTAWMNRRQAEIEAQHPEFIEISERLYAFWDKFSQTWLVETGLIDEATYKSWRKRWKYYVPFNRLVNQDGVTQGAKRGFANQNSTIKKARGSGKDIIHPVDNMIANLVKIVNAGVRNNVMVQITNLAQKFPAVAALLEKIPHPLKATKMDMTGVKEKLSDMLTEMLDVQTSEMMKALGIVDSLDDILIQYGRGKAHGNVITVLKDGQPEAWKINDPQLLQSLTNMAPSTMGGILDAYAVASRFMTANITGNNLIWSIFSNFPRDMMTLFTYSKSKNPAKVFSGVGSAYINKAKGDNADPLYKEFLALGGGQTSVYTSDKDLAKTARKKIGRKATKNVFKKFNPNPLDWISFVGNTVESGPRFATYKLCREQGMNPQDAFYEAMDITVNFRRGGVVSRELNKVIPFFNANVQGLDKFRRWITAEELAGKPNRKKAVAYRATTYVAVSAAMAALAYALNNYDDEKEKEYEQLSTYIKNSYWNIPIGDGKYFAIPKPRELGVLSSFFETCMEYGIGENDHAFDEFYAYASENFLPAIANDIAQVGSKGVVETGMNIIGSLGLIGVVGYLGANRDFLGRPIVSSGLQNLEPKDQYTDRTSKIAYWVGQAFNGSPQQIDYFFQQVLGGWWKTQKALFPVGSGNKDYSLGVLNTYVKDNQYSTDLTNWLYDHADTTARAKKSNPTDINKAIAAKWDSNMTSFYGQYYKQAKNKGDTTATRATRQTVLDMILEYQKGIDNDYKTKTQLAVEKVCRDQNSTEFLPSVMSVEVTDGNDKKHTLSDVQYVEYQTDYLRLYWETIEEALPEARTKAEQAQVITSAKKVAKEQATARTLSRIGAPASDFTKKYGNVSNDNLVDFFAGIAEANEDNSVKQAEVVDVISGMDVDDTTAWALYLSRYDSRFDVLAEKHNIPADTYMNAKLAMAGMKGKDRRRQVEKYLNSVCDNYKEYLFLLGMEYETVRRDDDYIMYFGKQD